MAAAEPQLILLRVDTVDQLFNDPDSNPFSSNELDVLGEAALEQLVTRLQVHPLEDSAEVRLVIALPPDQIQPDLQDKLQAAIRRYCAARIEENRLQIHITRVESSVGMVAVVLITLAAVLFAHWLLTTILVDIPSDIQGMIVAGVSVFAWVILWDPLESLLFDWVAPTRENRTLRRITKMPVVVEPQT